MVSSAPKNGVWSAFILIHPDSAHLAFIDTRFGYKGTARPILPDKARVETVNYDVREKSRFEQVHQASGFGGVEFVPKNAFFREGGKPGLTEAEKADTQGFLSRSSRVTISYSAAIASFPRGC